MEETVKKWDQKNPEDDVYLGSREAEDRNKEPTNTRRYFPKDTSSF